MIIWCLGPLPLPEQKCGHISPFISLEIRCIKISLDIENFPTENSSLILSILFRSCYVEDCLACLCNSYYQWALKTNVVLWLRLYDLVSTEWKTRCSLVEPCSFTAGHGWRISYFARTLYISEGLTHFYLSAKSQNISFDKKKNGMVWLYYADFDKKPRYPR